MKRVPHIMKAVVTLSCLAPQALPAGDIFPYQIHEQRLDNGLKVVVVPYDSPGTVGYFTVVRTGSRDEVEQGHSGFAHFFEHMMFRGTKRYPQDKYNDVLKRMGADSNAFTTDDRTQYYIIGPAAELETMFDIESDRFQNLHYSEDDFRREALAVLGEYNKNVSSPFLPMHERLRELAFNQHTYKHTTIGFLDDIKAMPGYYEYSLSFFKRFYRPENAVLMVVGDVQPAKVFELARKYYGPWEKGYQAPAVAAEPPQTEAKSGHVHWPSPIRPHIMMGYRAPAFSDSSTQIAALDLIGELLFSESAPLYQRLMVQEQWVDTISGGYSSHRDPYLFTVFTRVKTPELLPKVQQAIDEHLAQLAAEPVDAARLERIKSHLRYAFAASLDTPGAVGFTLGEFISLTGDPASVNRIYAQYQQVTPADIQNVAREIFNPQRRTMVTLTHSTETSAQPAVSPEGT